MTEAAEVSGLTILSASKLKVFSSCNRKFYYEYVEKQETKKHPAACLGSAVHRTIERVYKENVDPAETFSTEFAHELVVLDTDVDTAKLEKAGLKMVTQYEYTKRVPNDMEVGFLLPFPNQAHPLCQIRGYIDQVYEDFGFVDLKTNTYKPLLGVLDHDPQFIIYNWAFSEIYGYAPTNTVWNHLRTKEDLYANVSGTDKLDEVTRLVERILDNQLTGVWDRSVGQTCSWCSFRRECLGTEQ